MVIGRKNIGNKGAILFTKMRENAQSDARKKHRNGQKTQDETNT